MKAPALFCILLCFAASVDAQPWYKDKKVWLLIGASVASSAVATKEAHDCRERVGIGFCSGGYGPFAARETVNMIGTIGTDALGLWGRHMGIKEWFVLPVGYTVYNTYTAYDQTLKGCPAGQVPVYGTKYTCQPEYAWAKADLSQVTFVH
jgi:hypothetical protein